MSTIISLQRGYPRAVAKRRIGSRPNYVVDDVTLFLCVKISLE